MLDFLAYRRTRLWAALLAALCVRGPTFGQAPGEAWPARSVQIREYLWDGGDFGQDSLTEPGSFHKYEDLWYARMGTSVTRPANVDIVDDPTQAGGLVTKALRMTDDAGAGGGTTRFQYNIMSGYEGKLRYDEFELYLDQNDYAGWNRFFGYTCDSGAGEELIQFELRGQNNETVKPQLIIRIANRVNTSQTILLPSDFPVGQWMRLRVAYRPCNTPGDGVEDGLVSLLRWDGERWQTLINVPHNMGRVRKVAHYAAHAGSAASDNVNYRRRWVWCADGLSRHGLSESDPSWWRDYLHQLRSWWPAADGSISVRVWANYNAGLYGYDSTDRPLWGVQIARDPTFADMVYDGLTSDAQTVDADAQFCVAQSVHGLLPGARYYIRGLVRPQTGSDVVTGYAASFRTPSSPTSEPMTDFSMVTGTCIARIPMGGMEMVREQIEAGVPIDVVAVLDDMWYVDSHCIFPENQVTPEQWGYYWSVALNHSTMQRIAASSFLVLAVGDHEGISWAQYPWAQGGSWVGVLLDEYGDFMQGGTVNGYDWLQAHAQPWVELGYPDQQVGGSREPASTIFAERQRADRTTPIGDREVRFWKTRTREIDLALLDVRSWADYEQFTEGALGEMPRLGPEQLDWYAHLLADPSRNLKLTLMGLMFTPRYLSSYRFNGRVEGDFVRGEALVQDVTGARGTMLYADDDYIVLGKEGGRFVMGHPVRGQQSGAWIRPSSAENSQKHSADNWSRDDESNLYYSEYAGTAHKVYQQEADTIIHAPHANARCGMFSGDDHMLLLTRNLAPNDPRWLPEVHSAYASAAHGLSGTHLDNAALIADLDHDPAVIDYASNLGGTTCAGFPKLIVNERTGELTYVIREFHEPERRYVETKLEGYRFEPVFETPDCRVDFTGDGTVNFFDMQMYLQAFSDEDPAADFANDGLFDFFDVQAFLQAFAEGCP